MRTCSPEEAASLLRPVDTLGLGLALSNPDAFLTALDGRDDWQNLVVGGALLLGWYPVLTRPNVHYRCGFFGPAERLLHAQGADVQHVPGGFRQFAPILARMAPRVMAVRATPPRHGEVNLSLHHGATFDELVRAGRDPERLLVVETSPAMPWTSSLPPEYTNRLPLDLVDVLIPTDGVPFALEEPPPGPADLAIAEAACAFIPEAATLQIGIGTIPNAVAKDLAERPGGGYGVHSEMFTTGLMRLYQAGKVSNDAKGIFDGVSITTFALGEAELYRWLDGNDQVAFLPVGVVNDPDVIGRNRRFVSVNGALSVDLYGQVVADTIDGLQFSGVGGQEDFVAGAELVPEDHSLICLHSTTTVGGELRSRIVAGLPAGSVVSTPRHHTGVIVTEYGAADLVGLTVRERAAALAEIAHPDFRDELRAAAAELGQPHADPGPAGAGS